MKRSRFLAPGDKLGKHDLIRQIAVGGMAELYLARTMGIEGFEKLVVVKRILPQYADNASFVNMFLNEARLAATLHHPNIAQVYDIGQEAGEYFFSMEYVHGEDLGRLARSAVDGGIPISLDAALTLVAGLCAGLHHAHDKTGPDGRPLNVVHRDVSPSNVLVSYDGAVKLVDFGIARVNTTPGSTAGGLKGKISYMSPEQCRGKTVLDRRSDIFSVGTILYELTTGQLPFTDETEYAILNHIVNTDAVPPSQLVKDYPAALEQIVLRALARDPDQRYKTTLELQGAIEDFAHENRLRVSPLVLARLMSTLFPQRLEEWANARAQGAFFVEQHVVRTLIESSRSDAPAFPLPGDDAGPAASGPSQAPVAGEMAPEPEDESTAVTTPPITPDEDITDVRAQVMTPPKPTPVALHQPSPTPRPPVTTPAPMPAVARPPTPLPRAPTPLPRAPTPPPQPAQPAQPAQRPSTPVTQIGVAVAEPPPSQPPQRNTPHRIPTPVPGLPNAVPILSLQPQRGGTMVSNPSTDPEPVVAVSRASDLTDRVHVADLSLRKKRSKLPLVLVLVGALGAAAVTYVVLGRDDGSLEGPGTQTPVEPAKADRVELAKPDPGPAPEPKPKPEPEAIAEPEPNVEAKPEPVVKPEPEPEKIEPKVEAKVAPKAVPKAAPKKPTPKVVVKRPKPQVKALPKTAKPDPKPDAKKETQWKSGDSPFLPVRTDKR